jgi:hypothetical protein
MFAFQQIVSQSRRFAITFAVAALVGTSLASPCSSAQAAPAATNPSADLQVTFTGKRDFGNKVEYAFVIKNNGPDDVSHVIAYKEAQALGLKNILELQDNTYFSTSLKSGESQKVMVTCNYHVGLTCKQATVLALWTNINDPNTANNILTVK